MQVIWRRKINTRKEMIKMKKLNKFFGLLITMCMLVSLIPTMASAAAAGTTFTAGLFNYKVNTDTTTVTLTSIAADKLSGEVVIPSTVTDGTSTYTVTVLGAAFKGTDSAVAAKTKDMTKLVMADTITEITATSPFYACRFTEIHLSSGLTKHVNAGTLMSTFNECNLLYTVNIPAGITLLNGTFYDAPSVKNVILEGTAVRTLYMDSGTATSHAFADGKAINFYVPYTATPSSLFTRMGSGKLTPSYLYYEGDYVFDMRTDGSGTVRMYSLLPGKAMGETVVIPDTLGGKTVTQLYLYNYRNNQVTKSFTMPDTVTTIDSGTFYSWKVLENVHLSNALTNGGAANQLSNTFQFCNKLTTVEIPAGITRCWGTFKNSAVRTVKIKGTGTVDFFAGVTSDTSTRAWNDGTTGITIYYPHNGTAPTRYSASGSFTATVVKQEAPTVIFTDGDFTYTAIEGSNEATLTAIAAAKLSGAVTVPSQVTDGTKTYTVTKLGDAFKNVEAKTLEMTSLVLPDTITTFTGSATFYACKGLTSIHLPANLTGDSNGAGFLTNTFNYCTKLTTVEIPAGITKFYGTFRNSGVKTVTVNTVAQADFYAGSSTDGARAWTNGTTGITIYYPYNGTIPTRYNVSGSFTATAKKIMPTFTSGDFTFKINEDETSVTLTSAGNISGEVIVPSSVTYEGKEYTVTVIGNQAFNNKKDVTVLSLPNTVTTIGYQAFMNMTGLTSFDMPDSVTTIGYGTFYACSNLETVKLSKNLTGTLQTTFAYCSKLKNCVIPEGVTALNRTFIYCNIINTVVVPSTVTSITGDATSTDANGVVHLNGLFTTFTATDSTVTGVPTEPGFVVMGKAGSAIETYMNEKGWNFEAIDFDMPLAIQAPKPHEDKTVTVNVANFNKTDKAADMYVFCAYYSKANNSLIDAGIAELKNVGALGIESVTVNMSESYSANDVYARAFVWEKGTFAPFADLSELNETVTAE